MNDERGAHELVEAVQRDLIAGRHRRQIVAELVRQNWPMPAAREFVDAVQRSLKEYRTTPEGRAERALAGQQRMQGSIMWLVMGAVVAFAVRIDLGFPVHLVGYPLMAYGLFELGTGYFAWKQHQPALEEVNRTQTN